MSTRSSRASAAKSPSKASPRKSRPSNKRKAKDEEIEVDLGDGAGDADGVDDDADAYDEEEGEHVEEKKRKAYDSDALDEDSDFEDANADAGRKRKRKVVKPPKKAARTPRKKRKVKKDEEDQENEDEDVVDLKDGQEIVGEVVQAPKTGRVPPGQISKNTFNFLSQLAKPECNDREWFKLHEPVYRLAEKEWKDFVDSFTEVLMEVDNHIPPLPAKDIVHRIYRDIRFSNDKTPYKRSFSASFSRSGRKGIFAVFRPGGQSLLAAGLWCPGRNELATIRSNLLRSSARLRRVISHPDFVKFFGEPKPDPKGDRQNIFGGEDELKVAPKGVDKGHKDIDLLKCRSFAVVHHFIDSEVLEPDFKEKLAEVARVVRPFVHCLNDLLTLHDDDDDNDNGEDEDDGGEDGEEGEE
ncbi:hypothetical protein D9758_017425 [Tetrapyrgos nigripes]|uniref:TIGR02453 family protein n=1 Tax=Tetrapyrgos nigripes TaxID=182062 RepID=A0A8H5C2Z7_9AGAR|nr:hypothetical protein D9758_017425 [Tetrapyrgos nigripes]